MDYLDILKDPVFNVAITNAQAYYRDVVNLDENLKVPVIKVRGEESLNAGIRKHDEKYEILINLGAVVILRTIFKLMMSNKNVLPEIGNVESEKSPKVYNCNITTISELKLQLDGDVNIDPVDPVRKCYSDLLFTHSLNFILTHEYAHMCYGHVAYLSKESVDFSFNEIEKTDLSREEYLTNQTLEMDADCYAVSMGFHQILEEFKEATENPYADQLAKVILGDIRASLECLTFSYYVLFRLFGFKEDYSYGLDASRHPQPGIRLSMAFGTLFTVPTEKYTGPLIDKMKRLLGDIFQQIPVKVEEAFHHVSEQSVDYSMLTNAYKPDAATHVRFLIKNWNNVRPLLEPFAMRRLFRLDNSDL